MAQPPAYARAFSFTDWTANNPQTPQPGLRLDVEYDAVATTLAAVRTNLALIQRDDGALRNESVGADQLNPDLTLGLRSVTSWATATAYIENDAVWTTGKLYRSLVAHTSAASFATDLAASKWELVFDPTDMVQEAVNQAIADDLIEVNVDTSSFAGLSANNTFSGNNAFSGTNTFSVGPVAAVASSTTLATYLTAKPTNYGVGHPGVFLRKRASQNEWELRAEDSAGTAALLDLVGLIRINGAAPPTTAAINTSIDTSERKTRHLILAY